MGYSFLPTIPGLFEFPFMTGAELRCTTGWPDFGRLITRRLSPRIRRKQDPVMRVIPIEQTINAHSEVLHFELVSEMLERPRRSGWLTARAGSVWVSVISPEKTCLMFDSPPDS